MTFSDQPPRKEKWFNFSAEKNSSKGKIHWLKQPTTPKVFSRKTTGHIPSEI
eukprot:c31851_g1_i1 orf=89-244(-)